MRRSNLLRREIVRLPYSYAVLADLPLLDTHCEEVSVVFEWLDSWKRMY